MVCVYWDHICGCHPLIDAHDCAAARENEQADPKHANPSLSSFTLQRDAYSKLADTPDSFARSQLFNTIAFGFGKGFGW
jgi:hypothetical protein